MKIGDGRRVHFAPFLFCKNIDEQLHLLAHSAEGIRYEPDTILRSTGPLSEGRIGLENLFLYVSSGGEFSIMDVMVEHSLKWEDASHSVLDFIAFSTVRLPVVRADVTSRRLHPRPSSTPLEETKNMLSNAQHASIISVVKESNKGSSTYKRRSCSPSGTFMHFQQQALADPEFCPACQTRVVRTGHFETRDKRK